ncbi:hypothetical protein NBRC116493_34360 [Aurantivibrio infirmus]
MSNFIPIVSIALALSFIIVFFITRRLIISGRPKKPDISDIRPHDHLFFFRTSAWLDETEMEWKIPIHGWIYRPQNSSVRKAVLRSLLKSRYDLAPDEETEVNFSHRTNLLLADNIRRRKISISLAGQTFALPKSTANGHFSTVLSISTKTFDNIPAGKTIGFHAITHPKDTRIFAGEVKLVSPDGISYISDIDDTIKVSEVNNRKALFENTFLNQFEAAAGMPELYRQLASESASFHYVSSSPWHLYPPLLDFVDSSGFPWASFELKYIRLKDKSLFNLFKDGTETKPSQIEPILLRYPRRRFVLLGDSGEQDPEVYSALLRKYPQQIIKIFIRNVDGQSATDIRFKEIFQGIEPDRWSIFTNPSELELSKLL